MPAPKILAFAGSTRAASLNKRVLGVAVAGAESAGAVVTRVDLRDLPMPLYDGDLEAEHGLPEHALALRALMIENDGLLIASPEYNGAFSAVLKNAIDWCSRPRPDETPLIAYKGKAAGLVSASPGRLGGVRGLAHLRQVLSNVGVLVLPDQVAVPAANKAFAEDGSLADAAQQAAVAGVGAKLAELLGALSG